MSVKLLTEHDLEFLSLKGGYKGLSESTLVKIPHCWKSHVAAHINKLYKTKASILKILKIFIMPIHSSKKLLQLVIQFNSLFLVLFCNTLRPFY